MSTEHDVSIVSGASVLNNLDKEKYEIFPIYIDAQGIWNKYVGNIETLSTLHVGGKIDNIEKIKQNGKTNLQQYRKNRKSNGIFKEM